MTRNKLLFLYSSYLPDIIFFAFVFIDANCGQRYALKKTTHHVFPFILHPAVLINNNATRNQSFPENIGSSRKKSNLTCRKFRQVRQEGKRMVEREMPMYLVTGTEVLGYDDCYDSVSVPMTRLWILRIPFLIHQPDTRRCGNAYRQHPR